MMYEDKFILAVMHEGSPVREISDKVTLPFNSEYKIRLKNKNNVRAKARVWIDGRRTSSLGDFILNPGETLDLERFLDESMSEGKRFKFVPLSDKRVNDPTDYANGIIKVEFYLEQVLKIDWNKDNFLDTRLRRSNPTWYYTDSSTTGINPNFGKGSSSGTFTSNSFVSNSINCNYVSSPGQAGATVEGSNSNQQFVEGEHFEVQSLPVTLSLKIQGPRKENIISKPRPKARVRFCGGCAARRQRRDNFCRKCGYQFPS